MQFTDVSTDALIVRLVSLSGGPVVDMAHSSTGKRFRVDRARITYVRKGDGWIIDSWWDVTLSGVLLKKDGADSKTRTSQPAHYTGSAPWLERIIEALLPTSDLILPTGTWSYDPEENQ